MLFGGPQMGYFAPPVIHEIGLHGAGFDVAGVSVVGTPSVVIGRTPEFAWSVTSGFDDQVDTIAVEVHPEDRHRYRWNGEWRRMETETVVHRPSVLGALGNGDWPRGTVEQEIARIEERGDSMPVVAWNPDERIVWCQRTTTRGDELAGVFAWAELGRRTYPDGTTTPALDKASKFETWADQNGHSLQPAFQRRTHSSLVTDTTQEIIVPPLLCLGIYEDNDLQKVILHSGPDGHRTITAYIESLPANDGSQ